MLGYVDSDWDGNMGAMKSTTGYWLYLFLGFWCVFMDSKKQEIVVQSTVEPKYVAAASTVVNKAIWLKY